MLDPGEDFDGDGHLDVLEERFPPSIDTNGDGKPEAWPKDAQGKQIKHRDTDGDGKFDGNNVENVFLEFFQRGRFPEVDLSLIAMIAALAAIAGNGGLTNTPISNFTRDQGWGMGHKVGAIPSVVGGHGITLSHVGCVFEVTEESLPRWRRWVRHITRDQVVVWMVACLIGVSLPSILSVEFLARGTDASEWNLAALTAGGVQQHVTDPAARRARPRSAAAGHHFGRRLGQVLLGRDAVLRISGPDHQPDHDDGRLHASLGRCHVDRRPRPAQARNRQGQIRLFHAAPHADVPRPDHHLDHR